MLAVVGVQAKTDKYACNVTLGNTKDSNASYSDGTFSWSGTTNNKMLLFDNLLGNVDISKYKYLVVKVSNRSDNVGFRILIMCGGNYSTDNFGETYTQDEVKIDLTSLTYSGDVTVNSSQVASSYSNISRINIAGSSSATGSLKISASDVYLETDEYESMEITTTLNSSTTKTNPFQWYTSSDGSTKIEMSSGSLYKNQFGTAGTKEILSSVGSDLGYNNGFFDVAGYDNVIINIDSYDSNRDNQVRLLQATGATATSNFNIDVTAAGATTKSLSSLTTTWIAGLYTKYGSSTQDNSQAITSLAFNKDYNAASTTEFSIAASASSTVNYDRKFEAGKVYTICLPFAVRKADLNGTVYKFNEVTSDGVVRFAEANTPQAYTPYLFVPSADCTPFNGVTYAIVASADKGTMNSGVLQKGTENTWWNFQGTLAHIDDVATAAGNRTAYGWDASTGNFVKVGTGVSIDAFRGYILAPSGYGSSPARLNVIFDDEATGIQSVNGSGLKVNGSEAYYNLSGQRVIQPTKGLYIVNGKKVAIK